MVKLFPVILALLLVSCSTAPPHQKGGKAAQSLGLPPAMPRLNIVHPAQAPEAAPTIDPTLASQAMQQPENPLGESKQVLRRTITTTAPTGEVVTTVETAETVIGGSQSLAEIAQQIMGAEHWRNMAVALLMAVVAWYARKEWPTVAIVLAVGALVVAFFGLKWALGFAAAGGGIVVGYYILRAQIPLK